MVLQHKPRRIKNKFRPGIRTMIGSGIVEGMVALMMILGITFLTVILLLNTGVATYDKEKIAFVADQAATYATSLPDDNTRQPAVDSFVNTLFSQMGVQATNTTVQVSDTASGGYGAVSVSVSSSLPTIMSSGFSYLVPPQIQVSDTAVAIRSPYANNYLQGMDPLGGQVVIPLINATGSLPPDNLQAWSISLTAGVAQLR